MLSDLKASRQDIRNLEFGEDDRSFMWRILQKAIRTMKDETDEEPMCSYDPDAFFPEGPMAQHPSHSQYPISVCNSCPLQDLCATYATLAGERDGFWGGLSPNKRRLLRKELIHERAAAEFAQIGYLAYQRSRVQANKR